MTTRLTSQLRTALAYGTSVTALFLTFPLALPADALIVLPQSGTLTFEVLEGHGATSLQEFGIGTPSETSLLAERQVLFQVQLVDENVGSVLPSAVVTAGYFTSGTSLDFYERSDYQGGVSWAFSSHLQGQPTFADLEVFTDRDASLGLGGSAVEQLSATSWLLRLDGAASVDDDDNDLVIGVTLAPAPEPSASLLFLAGTAVLAATRAIPRPRGRRRGR